MQTLEMISTGIFRALISGPMAPGYLRAGAPILTAQGSQQTAELDTDRVINDAITLAEKLIKRVKEVEALRQREAQGQDWAMNPGGTTRECRHGIAWSHPCGKCANEDLQRLNELRRV